MGVLIKILFPGNSREFPGNDEKFPGNGFLRFPGKLEPLVGTLAATSEHGTLIPNGTEANYHRSVNISQ